MSLVVRRASLNKDRDELLALLNRNFDGGQDARFDWRHLNNPAGEAWIWFVYNSGPRPIASAAVFPRIMYVGGKPVLCGQVGGFAVDAGHRSLGPAVTLQRATFEAADSGAMAFVYDCPPHDRGMSTFVRLGMRPNCEITRYALPLRSSEYLGKRMGSGVWAKPLFAAADLLLRARLPRSRTKGLEVTILEGRFGDEFNELDRKVAHSDAIVACRTTQFLNWRFREDPITRFHIITVHQRGELQAFIVFYFCETRAYIVDLFGTDLTVAGPALMDAAIAFCSKAGIFSMHGFCSNESELRDIYLGAGMRPREVAARVVAYEKANGKPMITHSVRWAVGHVETLWV